jgi:hypothetical protein
LSCLVNQSVAYGSLLVSNTRQDKTRQDKDTKGV